MLLKSNKENRNLVVLFLLFCINPVLGIVILTMFIICSNKVSCNRPLNLLFFMMAIYMGLLNATKTPASDQIQYMNAYLLVPKQSIWASLTNIYGEHYNGAGTTKEMGYGFLNIIGYILSFGYYPLFVLEFTVCLYMLGFKAIKRLFRVVRPNNWLILTVSAIYIMCFYSQYFNLTIHLQRQEIATAVMLMAIVDYCVAEKYTWKNFMLPLFAMTLHTSVGIFLPFFCLRKIFKDRIGKKQFLLIMGLVIVIVFSCVAIAGSMLNSLGGDVYALERLSDAGSSTEDSFSYSFLMIFTLPLVLIIAKNVFSKERNANKTQEYLFYVFFLAIVIFYLLTPDATMQYRYFMMSYSFWPFVIPLLFSKKSLWENIVLASICIFLFIRFYLTFENMPWQYTSVTNALTCDAISLFFKNPF